MNDVALAAGNGFLTSLALILAIGAQNAFVLRQGIMRQHVFSIVMVCALSDALLIGAGVAGFGVVTAKFTLLPEIMRYAGAAFLVGYGLMKLRAAWLGGLHQNVAAGDSTRRRTIVTILALTWLNPHVYLDTLGLLGAISTTYSSIVDKTGFAVGAISTSFLFFFALGYGARFLAPIMKTDATWRVLDLLIAILMLFLAAGLIVTN